MKQKDCGTACNETIAQKREGIKKLCGMAYVILTIGAIAWVVIGVMFIAEDIWTRLNLPIETVTVGWGWFWVDVIQLRFQESGAFIPILYTGWTPAGVENVIISTMISFAVFGFFLFIILHIRNIFKDLKNGGSPFNKKIASAAHAIAFGMAFLGITDGILGRGFMMLIPAALIALMGYIFDYGRLLQEESDTTL